MKYEGHHLCIKQKDTNWQNIAKFYKNETLYCYRTILGR